MTRPDAAPLILTARFEPAAAAIFQALRDRHFPAPLNIVPAHCTLFHHLPGGEQADIAAALATLAAMRAPLPFVTDGPRLLGRGVALTIAAPALVALRDTLARRWQGVLTPQDQQRFRPHVTVQNKVDPAVARALRDQLAAAARPVAGLILGLDLWHYRGGPWDHAAFFAFAARPAA